MAARSGRAHARGRRHRPPEAEPLVRRDPDARLAVFPSDHYAGDGRARLAHVANAQRIVAQQPDKIALLGMVPEHAAARIIARGGLRNSFVRVCRVARMLARLEDLRPGDVTRMEELLDRPAGLAAAYDTLLPWNFSSAFLARSAAHLVMVRAHATGWSDWGTPEAIVRTLATPDRRPPWWARLALSGAPAGTAAAAAA